jgi:uncharacterized protein (TIGR02147 family)
MHIEPLEPKAWLEAEYRRRRTKNPRYSLRMLAQKLDMPSGRLSEILAGKRRITPTLGRKIAIRLEFPPEKIQKFIATIENERAAKNFGKKTPNSTDESFRQLSVDSFYALAGWEHFALLNLMKTDDFKADVEWISNRLGLTPVEVRAAIERLERLEFIERTDTGFVRKVGRLTTTHDLESVALKASHRQSLEQAIESLETVPVELRDITSITMAIDRERIPQTKAIIKKFRRELSDFLESGSKTTEVYNLNIQLVPVTKVQYSSRENK